MPPVELRLLGPLAVVVGHRPLTFGGPREEKVLAALIADVNRVVSVAHLVDVVWDDEPPVTAAKQVRNAVSRLRAALCSAGVTATPTTEPAGYRLTADPHQLDTLRFTAMTADATAAAAAGDITRAADRLRAALRLWRGPALAGLSGRVIDSIAAGLNERRIVAQETLFDHELTLGRHREVLGDLTSLATAAPMRENLTALLMRALCQCGRRSDALATYRRTHNLLDTELGLTPCAALRDLHQRILQDDQRLTLRTSSRVPQDLTGQVYRLVGRC